MLHIGLPHVVGRQILEVDVATDGEALRLFDRIGEVNQKSFLPTIGRVLDEFDRADVLIRIDRLDLYLGTVPPDQLDLAAGRLEQALRDALSRTLLAVEATATGVEADTETASAVPVGSALLDLVERYLLFGIWPYTAPDAATHHPEALLAEIARTEPVALEQLLRRHRGHPGLLTRVAQQLPYSALELLMQQLAARRGAAPVLMHLPTRRELELGDPALARRQWERALHVLLEKGDEPSLLAYLPDAVKDDLPGWENFISAITGDKIPADPPQPPDVQPAALDRLAAFLLHGHWRGIDPEAVLLSLSDDDPEGLASLLRRHAHDDAMLQRLTEVMGEPALQRLLAVLDPDAAAPIIAYMSNLRTAHRAQPIVPLGETRFARQLWSISFRYVLREAGSRFNRKSYVKTLIADLADAERVSYGEVLAALRLGTQAMLAKAPLEASLLTIIAELAAELPAEPEPPLPPEMRSLVTATPEIAEVSIYERLEQFRILLSTGVLPWRAVLREPGLRPDHVLSSLRELRPERLGMALAGVRLRVPTLRRALDEVDDDAITELIRLLLPLGASALASAIEARTATAADRRGFSAKVLLALLEGQPLDLEVLAAPDHSELQHDASSDDTKVPGLMTVLARGVAAPANDAGRDWDDALAQLLVLDPEAARRFLAEAARRPATFARLAQRSAPSALDNILNTLTPAAAPILAGLNAVLSANGSGLDRSAVATAILGEALTIDPESGAGVGLLVRLLRRLFGAVPPRSIVLALRQNLLPRLPGAGAAILSAALAAMAEAPQPHATAFSVPRAGAQSEWLLRALADADRGHAPPGATASEVMADLLRELLEAPTPDVIARLVKFLSAVRGDVLRKLPEALLARLFLLAVPEAGQNLLDAAELLAEAAAAGKNWDRAAMWHALLQTAAAPAGDRSAALLARHFFAVAGRADAAPEYARSAAGHGMLQAATRLAVASGHDVLAKALAAERTVLIEAYSGIRRGQARAEPPSRSAPNLPARRPAQTPAPSRGRTAFRLGDDEPIAAGQPIYIGNAGLVLANPFLPHLFDALGITAPDERGKPRLRDLEAGARAVHLLQYLVDGRTDRPEPLLILNKLLCGIPIEAPVPRAIEPRSEEIELCDELLRSIIANWPIIRSTSVTGLRETFLQRDGKLILGDGQWRLVVQRKTLDVLVDQLPWSIGIVFHPWMQVALQVSW